MVLRCRLIKEGTSKEMPDKKRRRVVRSGRPLKFIETMSRCRTLQDGPHTCLLYHLDTLFDYAV